MPRVVVLDAITPHQITNEQVTVVRGFAVQCLL
jgi:hypothetical protein